MVGGSFVAVMAFKQIHNLSEQNFEKYCGMSMWLTLAVCLFPEEHPLPKGEVLALWIHGLMFLFLAFLAIFG